jgi:hypothetical protein
MYELDLSHDCSEWDSKPYPDIINSETYVVEMVDFQAHPLRHFTSRLFFAAKTYI